MEVVILTRKGNIPAIRQYNMMQYISEWNVSYADDLDMIQKPTSIPSVLISVENGTIIPEEVLDLFSYKVNIHRGDFANYRGASSLSRQVLAQEKYVCMTLHRMTKDVDRGCIYNQVAIKVPQQPYTYSEAEDTLRRQYPLLLTPFLTHINGSHYPQVQRELSDITFGPIRHRRHPDDSEIRLQSGYDKVLLASENDRWPAFVKIKGRKFILTVWTT